LLSDLRHLVHIDLDKHSLALELFRHLFVVRLYHLAWRAPRGSEINDQKEAVDRILDLDELLSRFNFDSVVFFGHLYY